MLVLCNEILSELLSPLELVAVIEDALRAYNAQVCVVPKRLHVEWDGNTLLAMPAVSDNACGTKIVTVIPSNVFRRLPVTNGAMLLYDRETGRPLALLNAISLTAQRTGAVGALGVKYITPNDISSIGIVGTGIQGTWQAIFACAVRPVRQVFCFDTALSSVETFCATLRHRVPKVTVTPCMSARELLTRTTVVITATTSSEPVLPDDPELLDGKHFISIGSFRPTMQELPDSVYRLAGQLFIDSEHARDEVGDVIRPVKKGILKNAEIFAIANLVSGQLSLDTSRTTVYKAAGMALFDLYVARALFGAAERRSVGQEITL